MAFAGVSVIAEGKLQEGSTTPTTNNGGGASGYHLLVIEGYSRTRAPPRQQPIRSRYFTIGGHRWSILYYPDGRLPGEAGYIWLGLHNDGKLAKPKDLQFDFSFVDETEKQEMVHRRVPIDPNIPKILRLPPIDRFVSRNALEKSRHLKDDSFTIRCDISLAEEDVTTPCIDVPPSQMKQNFTDLLLAGEGTDVFFRVGGEIFPAHRCVLAARSAVFKALLFGPMMEGTSTTVQIDDMEATVFKALLRFIYGDSLPAPFPWTWMELENEGVRLQHLLVAADKYGLQRLRAMCEERLCQHIGVSTATTILALAEQHCCQGLKVACYEFLRSPANLRAVVATDGFDHLCKSCPLVMKELILQKLHHY